MPIDSRAALCASLFLLFSGSLCCNADPPEPGSTEDPGTGGAGAGGSGGRKRAAGAGGAAAGGAQAAGGAGGATSPLDAAADTTETAARDATADGAAVADGGAGAGPDSRPDASSGDVSIADGASTIAQTPPQGRRLLDPWLAAGHYKSWKCEPAPVNARSGSPHGRTRICSNDLASRHGAGPYPVGAASVKEIYYGGRIGVYAVSVKISPGTTGNAWYWYEQNDMEGVGAPGCAGCHSRAERGGGHDYVYIQVK
jgi:hypothetical protein